MATIQNHIYSSWDDLDVDNNVKTMKTIIGDLSNITSILLTFLSDFNLYIENKATHKQLKQQTHVTHYQNNTHNIESKVNINKSPKRKREINCISEPLKNKCISEPLNKKQKLLQSEIKNNNEYDKDDQKEDEQYIEHIDEYDSELMSRKSEPVEQPQ
eukprot:323298_1